MKLEQLKNKTLLLLGKSRAFSADELEAQIRFHGMSLVDKLNEDVSYIVEGRMMSPYEQNRSEEIYETHKELTFISIDTLEDVLASEIDADTLLMSLKLSRDNDRLVAFLKNRAISDRLFLQLLKLYNFRGEDFFENDTNRDVSAALISRFYKNIERNHNVQYATHGLMHLILQTNDAELIEHIAMLEPLQKVLQATTKSANFSIVTSIATHAMTPKSILNYFVKKANTYVRTLIAMRRDCDAALQKKLFDLGEEDVLVALAHNKALEKSLALELIKSPKLAKIVAMSISLNEEFFELLSGEYSASLAKNETLDSLMQKRLVSVHNESVDLALAANKHLDASTVMQLLYSASETAKNALYANESTPQEILEEAYLDEKTHVSLAQNENTPEYILERLGKTENQEVLEALAKNQKTPVAVLYQLQLDRRFERYVKENPSFGKHIQTQNIGWEV
jgi:hypothetical protein